MRLTLLSDLHFEFYTHCESLFRILDKYLGADMRGDDEVLVLAGDIGWPISRQKLPSDTYRKILNYFRSRFHHVILVAGNHEYYQRKRLDLTMEDFEQALLSLSKETGVHYLQCDSLIIEALGYTFIGCTGWTNPNDYTYFKMNDGVKVFHNRDELEKIHLLHQTWLELTLAETFEVNPDAKVVIITHHPPTSKLLQDPYDIYVSGYSANWDNLIAKYPIKAWLAGHTHEAKAIMVDGTYCWVNPVGYKGEKRHTTTDYNSMTIIT